MRRALVTTLTCLLLLNLGGVNAGAAPNRGPCDEPRWLQITPKEWTAQLVKGLVRCADRRWPVPGGAGYAIGVFECESGLWPWAVGGDNLGIAQHKAMYWLPRVRSFLRPAWFNRAQWRRIRTVPQGAFVARANVIVAMRMAHGGGWGPWSCAD